MYVRTYVHSMCSMCKSLSYLEDGFLAGSGTLVDRLEESVEK